MEPYDSHYVRTVHGNVLAKRAYNTFPNWDDSDKDNARFTQIRQAQRDGVEMAEVPRDNLDSVAYESYFRPDDKDKSLHGHEDIIGSNTDGSGSDLLGNFQWDKEDYKASAHHWERKVGAAPRLWSPMKGTFDVDGQVRGLSPMCDQGFHFKSINGVTCDSLGLTVSTRMNVFGGVMIHEWTHFVPISEPVRGDLGTGDLAYGPLAVRGLSDEDKLINADSYAWHAQEQFWRTECNQGFSGPRDDRDTQGSECGESRCIIQ